VVLLPSLAKVSNNLPLIITSSVCLIAAQHHFLFAFLTLIPYKKTPKLGLIELKPAFRVEFFTEWYLKGDENRIFQLSLLRLRLGFGQ